VTLSKPIAHAVQSWNCKAEAEVVSPGFQQWRQLLQLIMMVCLPCDEATLAVVSASQLLGVVHKAVLFFVAT
jgi:hypothetical protein